MTCPSKERTDYKIYTDVYIHRYVYCIQYTRGTVYSIQEVSTIVVYEVYIVYSTDISRYAVEQWFLKWGYHFILGREPPEAGHHCFEIRHWTPHCQIPRCQSPVSGNSPEMKGLRTKCSVTARLFSPWPRCSQQPSPRSKALVPTTHLASSPRPKHKVL